MRNIKALSMMLGLMALSSEATFAQGPKPKPKRRRYEEEPLGGIPDQPRRIIPKGLKEFKINGEYFYATNHKNALKKAKKKQA